MQTHRTDQDVTVLADSAEIPGLGFLPVNAYVIHAEQPVVIDTGPSTDDKDFVSWLSDTIDPPTYGGSGSPILTATQQSSERAST